MSLARVAAASIRPRLLARGDPPRRTHRERRTDASIRPRLLARGDVPFRASKGLKMRLQFGHACLRVETTRVRDGLRAEAKRFNSATPACAWRRCLFPRDMSSLPEASIRPRLLARGDGGSLVLVAPNGASASIRPRLLARGDLRLMREAVAKWRCFNSATPACAWRPVLRSGR